MMKSLFMLAFILCFGQFLSAQQWISSGSLDTISLNFEFKKSKDLQQKKVNRVLSSIAYSHQKPAETIHVNWNLIASYQVFRQKEGHFKSDIFIKALAPQGNLNIYEFNSALYILPQLQSFRLRIFKEDGNVVYLKIFNQNSISVNSIGQIAQFSILHQRWAVGWHIEIDQFEFDFNATEYSFEQWFQYTNDYKAANYLVDEQLNNYRYLQQSPQEPIPFLIKSLLQVNYLKKLYQMPFYRATIVGKNDPDKLSQKMNMLSTLLGLNIEKYAENVKNSFSLNNNVDYIIDTYLFEEENLHRIQQNYSSIYKELFKELSKNNYPANLSYKNINFFDLLGDDYYIDNKQLVRAFENSLCAKSIANIDSLIQLQQFSEALFYVDNLEGFANYANDIQLNDLFNQKKAIAAYGMYYSYVDVADKAIKLKNSNFAVQYLKKAEKIQETYSKEIITNSLVKKKLKQLLNICYDDYYQMIEQNKYYEASAKRDSIREIITDFQLDGMEYMLEQFNMLDNQAFK